MRTLQEHQGGIRVPVFPVETPVIANGMPVRLVANAVSAGFPSPAGDDLEDEIDPISWVVRQGPEDMPRQRRLKLLNLPRGDESIFGVAAIILSSHSAHCRRNRVAFTKFAIWCRDNLAHRFNSKYTGERNVRRMTLPGKKL
jgi:hypothetical protein